MTATVTAREFAGLDLVDWRYLLRRIEANFTCPSYAAGGALAARIAALADEQNHHPEVDLRWPGLVHVVTSSHDAGGVTQRDLRLARSISAAAVAAGASSDPLATTTLEIALDAIDIDAVRPFWAAVLGYVEKPPSVEGDLIREVVDPRGVGPALWFQQMDVPRTERNRFHLDVTVPHDVAEARLEATLAAGGRLVSDARAKAFWVLADAEGNEACICTWQDRAT